MIRFAAAGTSSNASSAGVDPSFRHVRREGIEFVSKNPRRGCLSGRGRACAADRFLDDEVPHWWRRGPGYKRRSAEGVPVPRPGSPVDADRSTLAPCPVATKSLYGVVLALGPSTHEGVTAGAALRFRFMVGDVLVASHARGTVGASPTGVNVVTCRALAVTLILRGVWDAMKAGQLRDLVTGRAGGACCHASAVWLVARCAVTVSFGALQELLFVTARACQRLGQPMHGPLVARLAARMALISRR